MEDGLVRETVRDNYHPDDELFEATCDVFRPLGITRARKRDIERGEKEVVSRGYAVAFDAIVLGSYIGIAYIIIRDVFD